jgi:hypothetical protein
VKRNYFRGKRKSNSAREEDRIDAKKRRSKDKDNSSLKR